MLRRYIGAAGRAIAVTAAEQFWWVAPALSGAAFLAVIWFNWGRQEVRRLRLKRPAKVYLTLHPKAGHDSWAQELYVPANTRIELQLRVEPRLSYQQQNFVFGFGGDEGQRPMPLAVMNHFIKRGQNREETPATNATHFVDYNDAYHIRQKVERTKGDTFAYGFAVHTMGPGRYPIKVQIWTEFGSGVPSEPLFLTVEETRPRRSAQSSPSMS